jgi:hypothetical protein
MVKKIIIINIALMSGILLNQMVMDLSNFPLLIHTECLVDPFIHIVADNHEEDNLPIEYSANYCFTVQQNISSSPGPYIISGISPSVWRPPE